MYNFTGHCIVPFDLICDVIIVAVAEAAITIKDSLHMSNPDVRA